jgi:hypothetical protein
MRHMWNKPYRQEQIQALTNMTYENRLLILEYTVWQLSSRTNTMIIPLMLSIGDERKKLERLITYMMWKFKLVSLMYDDERWWS